MAYAHRILSFQLPPEAEWHDFISRFYARYNYLYNLVLTEFGPNGFMILFLLCIFLLIIAVIYIKTIADTFRAGAEKEENPETELDGLFYTIENPELALANDNDENQLQLYNKKELEKIKQEQDLSTDLILASQRTADYLNLEQDYLNLKQKMQKHAEAAKQNRHILENMAAVPLTEINTEKEKISLPAIILNLLSHNVTESKIIQAIYYYYKAQMSEEEVMQTVETICNFISLCNAGKFNLQPQNPPLPPSNTAIMDLARGDSSTCLFLLQALLNTKMQQAETQEGIVRDLTYAMATNIACIMGNIAYLSDHELARNSYELATELSPKNVLAWSRLGDIYMQEKAIGKAMIAYQNVLDISDHILYARQIANAHKRLAEYYMTIGLDEQARQMQSLSSDFYKSCGINTPLSQGEITVYKMLERDSEKNLPIAVNSLLSERS